MSHMLNFGLKSKLKGYDPIGYNADFSKGGLLRSIFFSKRRHFALLKYDLWDSQELLERNFHPSFNHLGLQ